MPDWQTLAKYAAGYIFFVSSILFAFHKVMKKKPPLPPGIDPNLFQ